MTKSIRTFKMTVLICALVAAAVIAEAAGKKKRAAAPEPEASEEVVQTFPNEEAFAQTLPAKLVAGGESSKNQAQGSGNDPVLAALAQSQSVTADSAASSLLTGATGGESNEMEAIAPVVTAPVVDKRPESEIPVLTQAKAAKKEAGSGYARILISLGVLAILFGGASFGLKRWSNRRNSATKQNTRIKVLTQHPLGPKKSLAIVQVAGESILIGITDQNISMLRTLSLLDDEIPEAVPKNFDGALSNLNGADIDGYDGDEDEDFAVRGLDDIRDRVSSRSRSSKNY